MTIPAEVRRILSGGETSRIAVVGASNNPDKYGNMVVRTLVEHGLTVLPVNPSDPEILGMTAWSDISSVPDPVHLVSFVTPPQVTARVIASMDPARFPAVWFQDGSWDDAGLELARSKFPTVVQGACIMVAVRVQAGNRG